MTDISKDGLRDTISMYEHSTSDGYGIYGKTWRTARECARKDVNPVIFDIAESIEQFRNKNGGRSNVFIYPVFDIRDINKDDTPLYGYRERYIFTLRYIGNDERNDLLQHLQNTFQKDGISATLVESGRPMFGGVSYSGYHIAINIK